MYIVNFQYLEPNSRYPVTSWHSSLFCDVSCAQDFARRRAKQLNGYWSVTVFKVDSFSVVSTIPCGA